MLGQSAPQPSRMTARYRTAWKPPASFGLEKSMVPNGLGFPNISTLQARWRAEVTEVKLDDLRQVVGEPGDA
jgi:hypothetical protein